MSTHDTDPQRSSAFGGSGETTEPGPPPETTDANAHEGDTEARLAASLLADLAKAPLPTEGVRETDGHTAAAIAVAAHRPPRATENASAEPAVLLNTTEPLPRPALVLAGAAGIVPSDGASASGESKGLEARRSAVQYSTVPSARVHRRQTAAVVIVIAIAVLAAASIVAFVPREGTPAPVAGGGPAVPRPSPTVSVAAPAPTVTSIATPTPASASTAIPTATSAAAATSIPTPTPTATPPSPSPVAQPAVRAPAIVPATASAPRPAASAPRAPRSSSGSFEEPDRNF